MSEHWLYAKARHTWERTQREQIKKGQAKYPTALGDAGLSAKQLLRHAVEENVDQMHYLTALGDKVARYEDALLEMYNRHDCPGDFYSIIKRALDGKA